VVLVKLKEELARRSQLIKKAEVFSLDYVPREIYERPEIQSIRKSILSFLRFKLPQNVLLIGPSGTGKTLSVLKYRDEIRQDFPGFEVRYINCREAYTSYRVISRLARIPMRGISLDEAFQQFFQQQKAHLLLILDEVDKLRDHEILYAFSRAQEIASHFPYAISLFLISNNPRWSEGLDSSIASSLRLVSEVFGTYNAEELGTILAYRVREGLYEGVCPEELIRYIAGRTVKDAYADTRVAILTLLRSGLRAETERKEAIALEDVEEEFERAHKDLEVENLQKLNLTPFLILYAASQSPKKSAPQIYAHYQAISREVLNRDPVKYVQFHNNLAYLQSQNLVQLWKTKVANYYVTEIRVTVPLTSLKAEFERRDKAQQL